MLFSSIPFLYYFLPAVIILYCLSPKRLKNTTLLLASLFFYAWGEPVYVFLMLATIICGFFLGLAIEKYRGSRKAKLFLALSVIIDLSALAYFKYADFFIENFNAATGLSVPLLGIALPIGISFYTFQILSYTIDVYRGDVKAQRNPITLAAYITMFPQLIAGPIVRYSDVEHQLTCRTHSFEKAAHGVRLFVLGLAKKILLANQLGELCDIFRASGDKSVAFFWLYSIAFALHVYFDFSGYSDMARGLGKLLGFDFMENFNYPFISKSASEFWRRWHISLGSWFRDYVYIPMGGNRVKISRWLVNILTVWLLTGFWHGAAWTFVVWGLYFAVFLVAEKLIYGKYLERSAVLSRIYTVFIILISFVIFNATDMSEAVSYIGAMFGSGDAPLINAEFVYYIKSYALLLVISLIGATPLPKKLMTETRFGKSVQLAEPVFLAVLLVIMTAYLADGSFNPFLYFRF
ncbi:MAG: MBOAT family protein [Oscillospiraceae bacterium]|nr:MBOAT family protein [Oscillospiraceae bacterium]